jgi:hypothetical protein
MMVNRFSMAGWRLWLAWVTATTLGVFASNLIAAIAFERGFIGVEELVDPTAFIILTGTVTATVQWRVLRQVIPHSARWILVNLAGSVIGAYAWSVISRDWIREPYLFGSLISLSVYGAVISYTQWRILNRFISEALLWIPFSVAGILLSAIVALCVKRLAGGIDPFLSIGDWYVLLMVYGFIQATALVWLLKRNQICRT